MIIFSKQRNFRWVVLGLATLAQALATFVTYGVGPLAAIWQQKFSLSQTQVGLLISVVNIGPLLSMLFIGRALDRYGERWIIGIGSILLGITMGLASFLSSYGALLFLLFLVGIHYGTAQPGGSKVVVKWFDLTQRGLAMGIRQAGIPIGGAMAGWFIPLISTRYHWPAAVVLQAILAIAGGLAFLTVYRDPAGEHKKAIENYRLWNELKNLFRQKQLYPLLFAGYILVSLQMVLVAHLMIFLKSTMKDITLVLAGQMLSVCLLFGMLGRIILAWLSDKVWKGDRIRPLVLSISASGIGLMVLSVLPRETPIWSSFILCAWMGFFGIGWYSLFIVEVAEKSSQHTIGLTVSYALTMNQAAIITSPILFGLLVDWLNSYFISWMLLAVLLSVSGIWLWSAYSKKEAKDNRSVTS
ncbi:MFS transporter [Paenactinomyces guangxiensis]|uniref:MFS transporter n=1 Tax=Paenactinomyces guangxiensis TaxID=1490290 RepID=A0A7W1WPR1_9BACL|nr:MFS transporter [Paenactinomyces guangxiensis]MBA4493795.1 MFS transporter [Paenactinomyces guangxiensis]MBH8591261.1 MFS transporter [Paenactinomyces guangxiensis]